MDTNHKEIIQEIKEIKDLDWRKSQNLNELIFLENEWILTKKQIDDNTQKIIDYFEQFHKNNPYRKGVIKEEILNYIKIIDFNFLDVFLQYLLKNNQLKKTVDIWSLISF